MAYFMINDIDYSTYVSGLKVSKAANYSAQTNAAGNTVVDYINSKKTIEVTIIPLNDAAMQSLKASIEPFNVSITYRNPATGEEETIDTIIESNEIEYYTIQANRVLYKPFTLTFVEL